MEECCPDSVGGGGWRVGGGWGGGSAPLPGPSLSCSCSPSGAGPGGCRGGGRKLAAGSGWLVLSPSCRPRSLIERLQRYNLGFSPQPPIRNVSSQFRLGLTGLQGEAGWPVSATKLICQSAIKDFRLPPPKKMESTFLKF